MPNLITQGPGLACERAMDGRIPGQGRHIWQVSEALRSQVPSRIYREIQRSGGLLSR